MALCFCSELLWFFVFFFFSSRRRHTRSLCDWSSDVCSSDLTPNVVGEIKRHFRDKGWAIRVPRALQELNGKMGPTIERLTSKLGRSPSIAEIAAEFETSTEQVLEALEAGSAYAPLSLSAGPGGEDELDPMETIGADDEEYDRTDDRTSLEPALAALPPREREILRMRFE